jgi:peroxiredoxin family protein
VPPLLIHLHAEGFERAYQALTLALTARAMGQEVSVVFAFGALRALAEDRLGEPLPGTDLWSSQRAASLGVITPKRLLEEARAAGVTLWACETVVQIAGIDPEDLVGKAELTGLATILRQQQRGQVLYL